MARNACLAMMKWDGMRWAERKRRGSTIHGCRLAPALQKGQKAGRFPPQHHHHLQPALRECEHAHHRALQAHRGHVSRV
eukprot:231176-Rhodomonas_salina.3